MFTCPTGRQGRRTEPAPDIYKSEINALSGALHCLHLEAHAQCAYLWLIYELRLVIMIFNRDSTVKRQVT